MLGRRHGREMNLFFWRRARIAVIELQGTLAARPGALSLETMVTPIERAFAATAKGGAVVLDISSPGGSPVQSELIAGLIRRLAVEKNITVHAVIGEVGASGGYWLACAADQIYASAMSIVGSIGVVGGGFGFDALLGRIGIERRLYTAGANKARLDPFLPERPEDVEFVQALMADIHARFRTWVTTRRGERLSGDVFDGSFFLGERAIGLGLIDGLATVDELVERLVGDRTKLRRYNPKRRFMLRLPKLLMQTALDEIEGRRLSFQ